MKPAFIGRFWHGRIVCNVLYDGIVIIHKIRQFLMSILFSVYYGQTIVLFSIINFMASVLFEFGIEIKCTRNGVRHIQPR